MSANDNDARLNCPDKADNSRISVHDAPPAAMRGVSMRGVPMRGVPTRGLPTPGLPTPGT